MHTTPRRSGGPDDEFPRSGASVWAVFAASLAIAACNHDFDSVPTSDIEGGAGGESTTTAGPGGGVPDGGGGCGSEGSSPGWKNPDSDEYITPYDFPVCDPKRRALLQALIGNGDNALVGDVYSNIEDVYEDFGLDPDEIMTCQARHERALDDPSSSVTMVRNACRYFCDNSLGGSDCSAVEIASDCQVGSVYRSYCLDLDDSLDWLALQAAALDANGRILRIPGHRKFMINQVLVLPSDSHLVWMGDKVSSNGRAAWRDGASPIEMVLSDQQREATDDRRGVASTHGTVIVAANMPFAYSGSNPWIASGPSVSNVRLEYAHVNAGGFHGENGISFAQGVKDVTMIGGIIENVKINAIEGTAAPAGGKAIQCEAGCRDVSIEGIVIRDAHIGINSNVIAAQKDLQPADWDKQGYVSDIAVAGLYMENVDIPINVLNDLESCNERSGSQRVRVSDFYIMNSGRMPDDVWLERVGAPRDDEFGARVGGTVTDEYFPPGSPTPDNCDKPGPHKRTNMGLVSSRGAYNVVIDNGVYQNELGYGGITALIDGDGTYSKLSDVEYLVRFICDDAAQVPGCP
ncbi:MAG: hypothetical protein HOW73_48405 [Polyangiaceae bacterium]|nr:hypothetical protein [Polyangiaceae bacterium]